MDDARLRASAKPRAAFVKGGASGTCKLRRRTAQWSSLLRDQAGRHHTVHTHSIEVRAVIGSKVGIVAARQIDGDDAQGSAGKAHDDFIARVA